MTVGSGIAIAAVWGMVTASMFAEQITASGVLMAMTCGVVTTIMVCAVGLRC